MTTDDDRLYGLPGDEYMQSDPYDVWELWWDGNDEHPWEEPGWSLTIQEWSVKPSSSMLMDVDLLLERIVENSFEYDTTEDHYESMWEIIGKDTGIAVVMQSALDYIGKQIDRRGWRMSHQHLADHVVTFADGVFLLDGEPTDWRVD